MINVRALKKMQTLPDDPEFIIGIEGKDIPVKVGVSTAKSALGITALENTVSTLPAAPTTAIVNISSAQILAMGTTPIELLPALVDLNQYYDIDKVILESIQVTTQYTFGVGEIPSLYLGGTAVNVNPVSLNTGWNNTKGSVTIREFSNPQSGVDTGFDDDYKTFSSQIPSDTRLTLSTYNSTNPTGGDGTLRAIITYTVRTFGA